MQDIRQKITLLYIRDCITVIYILLHFTAFIFTVIYCHLWSPFWCFSFKLTVFSFTYHRSFVWNVIMLSIDILYHLWLGTLGPAKLMFSLNHIKTAWREFFWKLHSFFLYEEEPFWIYVKEDIFNFVLKTSHMFFMTCHFMNDVIFVFYIFACIHVRTIHGTSLNQNKLQASWFVIFIKIAVS